MYFFYIDESGDRKPTVKQEEPFVMVAVGLHEYQWKRFEATINTHKLSLLKRIYDREKVRLDLAAAEIRSSDIRIPTLRQQHPFLKHLTEEELRGLVGLFFDQLAHRHFTIMATVVDKACLRDYMDLEKLTKKVYELLLERGESFIANDHPNQQALFVLDNTSRQLNRSVAMKHSYFQREGTSSGVRLRHIVEMPFFVESYLSNGVQLADLCSYNIFRAFRNQQETYPWFQKLLPHFYTSIRTSADKIDGLKVFPDNHRWQDFMNRVQTERARILNEQRAL